MKNQREWYRIGLLVMTFSLSVTLFAGILYVHFGNLLAKLLLIVSILLFTYGMTLTIFKGRS